MAIFSIDGRLPGSSTHSHVIGGLSLPGPSSPPSTPSIAGLSLPGPSSPPSTPSIAGLSLPGPSSPPSTPSIAGLSLPGPSSPPSTPSIAGLSLPGPSSPPSTPSFAGLNSPLSYTPETPSTPSKGKFYQKQYDEFALIGHAPIGWRDLPLPSSTPVRKRKNVARFRSMGGDVSSVPPDFNPTMKSIWDELWMSLPQSGGVGANVKQLIQKYKKRCQDERQSQEKDQCPLALLPVSFAQAKDWLLKKQKIYSEAIVAGTVNEAAREVVTDLNRFLTEQPTSTALMLQQPPCPASPVIPTPQFSLGPDPITDEVRNKEQMERRKELMERRVAERNDPTTCAPKPKKPKPKKPKSIPPELEERQQRAQSRMLQLGVSPVDVRILHQCMHAYICIQSFLICIINANIFYIRMQLLKGVVPVLFATSDGLPMTKHLMGRFIVF